MVVHDETIEIMFVETFTLTSLLYSNLLFETVIHRDEQADFLSFNKPTLPNPGFL